MDEELARHIVIGLLRGQILREDIVDPKTGETIAEEGTEITRELAEQIARLPLRTINIRPIVTNEVHYLPADEEDKFIIAQANAKIDENNRFEVATSPAATPRSSWKSRLSVSTTWTCRPSRWYRFRRR